MKKNIYKKCLKVLTKEGTIQTLDYKNKIAQDDVLGFILNSGKIVSKNYYGPTKFSENKLGGYPKKLMVGDNENRIKSDNDGKTNTENLKKYCEKSGLLAINYLGENEYLPSIGELLEIFDKEEGELRKLNLTRKLVGLEPLEDNVYYWTSTIRNEETVWYVCSNFYVSWECWFSGWDDNRVISFLGSY